MASKQMVRARAPHIRATIDMPYPYRDLMDNHHRYTISEWRWILEYSPIILAPYVKISRRYAALSQQEPSVCHKPRKRLSFL